MDEAFYFKATLKKLKLKNNTLKQGWNYLVILYYSLNPLNQTFLAYTLKPLHLNQPPLQIPHNSQAHGRCSVNQDPPCSVLKLVLPEPSKMTSRTNQPPFWTAQNHPCPSLVLEPSPATPNNELLQTQVMLGKKMHTICTKDNTQMHHIEIVKDTYFNVLFSRKLQQNIHHHK